VLAGFELAPTAPLGREKQRQRDQESRRSYRVVALAHPESRARRVGSELAGYYPLALVEAFVP